MNDNDKYLDLISKAEAYLEEFQFLKAYELYRYAFQDYAPSKQDLCNLLVCETEEKLLFRKKNVEKHGGIHCELDYISQLSLNGKQRAAIDKATSIISKYCNEDEVFLINLYRFHASLSSGPYDYFVEDFKVIYKKSISYKSKMRYRLLENISKLNSMDAINHLAKLLEFELLDKNEIKFIKAKIGELELLSTFKNNGM